MRTNPSVLEALIILVSQAIEWNTIQDNRSSWIDEINDKKCLRF